MFRQFDGNNLTDSFNKIRTLMNTQDGGNWQSLSWKTGDESWMKNTGNGANAPVIIGMKLREDAAKGVYGISLRVSPNFDATKTFDTQPGASDPVFFNLWDNKMSFWYYSSTRRIVIAAKVNTVYVSMYAGMFLPFSTPDEYPFPLYVGGNYDILSYYGVQDSANRMITSPGINSAFLLPRDSASWVQVANHDIGGTNVNLINSASIASIWPDNVPEYSDKNLWGKAGFENFRPNVAGELPAFPAHIYIRGTGELIGVLEGIYTTPGFGRVSEQIVKYGPVRYRLFQNIFRTGGNQFFAVAEI